MDTFGSPGRKATILDQPEGYQIVAPATHSVPVVIFLALWMWGWAAGEVFAFSALLSDRTPLAGQAFLAVWLILWSLGGAAALSALLFQLFGTERLVLAADEIRVRREVFGLGGWKHLPLDRVRGLRALGTAMPDAAKPALALAGIGGGGILVLTDGRPLRFGFSLAPEESAELVRTLRQRHAFPGTADADSTPQPRSPHAA